MARYALIHNQSVVNVATFDSPPEKGNWVAAGPAAEPGGSYVDGVFTPRRPPTAEEVAEMFEQQLLQSDLMRLFAKALARDLSIISTRLSNGQSIPAATEQQIMQRWKQYVSDGLVT